MCCRRSLLSPEGLLAVYFGVIFLVFILTNEVKSAKSDRRRDERKWRRTKLHSDFLIFKALKNRATAVMKQARRKYYTSFIEENSHDQRKLFRSTKTLFDQETDLSFNGYHDNIIFSPTIWSRYANFNSLSLSLFFRC